MDQAGLFRARGLRKVYTVGEVEVVALRSLDLDLEAGEFVLILGPSGSGKSTLINILGGLDAATAGTVTFRDHVLTDASEKALTRYRREQVGFVFRFCNLIPSLTALENVQLATELAAEHAQRAVERTWRLVHVGGFAQQELDRAGTDADAARSAPKRRASW